MKLFSLLLFLINVNLLAADQLDPVRPSITYTCTTDNFMISGSDGTIRSCYPYVCSLEDLGKSYTPTCRTHCLDTIQCQPGTVCDLNSNQCITSP